MPGPTTKPSATGTNGRNSTEGTETVRDNPRGRSGERISTLKEIEMLESNLVQGFKEGDPEQAWEASQALLELSKRAVIDAAKSRYQKNFGTSRCENCTGLKVVPGVIATCFQLKQCYYKGLTSEDLTERQLRVLRSF